MAGEEGLQRLQQPLALDAPAGRLEIVGISASSPAGTWR